MHRAQAGAIIWIPIVGYLKICGDGLVITVTRNAIGISARRSGMSNILPLGVIIQMCEVPLR